MERLFGAAYVGRTTEVILYAARGRLPAGGGATISRWIGGGWYLLRPRSNAALIRGSGTEAGGRGVMETLIARHYRRKVALWWIRSSVRDTTLR